MHRRAYCDIGPIKTFVEFLDFCLSNDQNTLMRKENLKNLFETRIIKKKAIKLLFTIGK